MNSFDQRFHKLKSGSSFEERFKQLASEPDQHPSFEDRFQQLSMQSQEHVQEPVEEESFFSRLIPKPHGKPVYFEEKSKEEVENMSPQEFMQYARDLATEREFRQSKGFTKGALSGLTLGASEHIPGLKPEEGDLLTGLGETIGSFLPISKLYNVIGKPIVNLASRSPVARQGLMALGRMTGFGLTGMTYEAGKDIVKGEVPTKEELLKTGAQWAAIDGALQALGLGVAFSSSVRNIAREEGVSSFDVLKRLWNATKNYSKSKFGSPVKEVLPEDIEVLVEKAKVAETGGLKEAEVDVFPEELKPEVRPTQIAEETLASEKAALAHKEKPQELSIPENAVVEKPEHITTGIRAGKGVATVPVREVDENGKEFYSHKEIPLTKEEKEIIDASNAWSEAGDEKESSDLANQAREMIFDRLKGEPEELPLRKTQVPPKQTRPLQPVVGKKQAVARSKILDLFRTAFNDPIRLGKIKQKAAGIHKLWPKVTRLLKDNDVETAAHEIGHNLHTTLYGGNAKTPQEQTRNIEQALTPYLNELKPLAHYEPWGMEGFAEFTRLYVTNPDVAQELAPNFYSKFEADLEAQYPEMKNALLEARDYYDTYLHGTPQSRIRAQTNYGEDKGRLANIVDWAKKKLSLDNLKTQFLDDIYPAKRLVADAFGIPTSEVENLKDPRNIYRTLRVLKGSVGKGDVFVLHETFNARTLDKVNGSLRDILKKLPDEESYREFNDYLIARRAVEKSDQNIETGINIGDALAVQEQLGPKYKALAHELDQYNDTLLKYARDSGLLSNKQYEMIRENNMMYVPFQRVMESEKGGAASGAGRLQAGKPIKRMKGSTRDIIAPIEAILKNTYSIIINSEKNMAGQVLAKIAKMKGVGAYVEEIPTPIKLKGKVEGEIVAKDLAKRFEKEGLLDLIEYEGGKPVLKKGIANAVPDVFLKFGAAQYPAGENIVTVFFDGKPKYYEVSPDLYEMWSKGIAPYTASLITKVLRIPAKTLRAGAILNPRFIQKNFIRDTWGNWLFTKYGKTIKDPVSFFIDTIYSPFSMLSTAAGKGKLYVEWLKSGGGMSTMQSLDRDHVIRKLDEVRHGKNKYDVIGWLRQAGEISEEMNRLSEFGKALKVEGQTRLGREIAAFAARDLSIDFAKIGVQTKALNQIIPFWNATVQGGDKLIRTLMNPSDRRNFLPRILGFIVLPSLMLAWLNKDDENVKEFYEEEKDFNFITSIGGNYIKIPVPFETGVIAHGLTQRMFNYFVNKDPEAFEKFMGSIMDAMSPSFIPSFASPFMEAWANKNFFTGARLIPPGKEDLISKYQYKNNTSLTSRLLGRAIVYMLGQETRSKAASPAIIDHFIHSWGGGLGNLMIKISDTSLKAAGLDDKIPGRNETIIEKLGLDAFSARFPRASTRSIEKFYDYYADATSKVKSFKHAEKMDLESEEELEKAYKRFDKIYDYQTLQIAFKAIQACQREINNIWNDPSIDQDSKQKFIDDLYLDMIQFAKEANEEIRQHRLTEKD